VLNYCQFALRSYSTEIRGKPVLNHCTMNRIKTEEKIMNKNSLFLSFRRVLNVVSSFLGNSPASEF